MRDIFGMRWGGMSRDRWAFGGWVALGLGLLLLLASIPLSVRLIQTQGVAGDEGVVVAGTEAASGSRSDAANFGDSATLLIRRGPENSSVDTQSGTANPAIFTGDTASASSAAILDVQGDPRTDQDNAQPAEDVASFSDSATLNVQSVPKGDMDEEKPAGDGSGGATNFSDTAQLVVRDSDGNVKDQAVVE